MRTIDMRAGSVDTRRPMLPFRAELRHLSSLCFPVLYQVLFTYVIVIADLVTPELGRIGFVLFAIFGILASSLATLWFMKTQHFNVGYFRVALPMLLALMLPLLQIALLNMFR